MATRKVFRIPAAKIRSVAVGYGGCIASDKITVDGEPVRFMERGEPQADEDSGWVFMAGTESDEYANDASKFEVYDINTIANYDPDIVPLLGAPPGSTFERRNNDGPLVPCGATEMPKDTGPPNWPPPGVPIVEGEQSLTKEWTLTLPDRYARRIEDGSLVLWRPGITVWINAWSNDKGEPQAKRVAELEKSAPRGAREMREEARDGATQVTYRLTEDETESLTVLTVSDTGQLQMSIYFDHDGDIETARMIAASVRHTAR
jgi:hypothetical protein